MVTDTATMKSGNWRQNQRDSFSHVFSSPTCSSAWMFFASRKCCASSR